MGKVGFQIEKAKAEIRQRLPALGVLVLLMAVACRGGPTPTPTEGPSPGVLYPEIAGRRVVEREVVAPPEPAPEFRLTDRSGRLLSLSDLRGRVVMLSFIYTHCPDACPLLAANYLQVQREFADAVERGDLALVFVTTDPERDTPKRLQQYTRGMGGKWYFLTGSMAEVKAVWEQYGIYREVRERTRELVVYHSYKTFLIDREGNIRIRHIGVWYPRDVIPDVRQLLEESGSGDSGAVAPQSLLRR